MPDRVFSFVLVFFLSLFLVSCASAPPADTGYRAVEQGSRARSDVVLYAMGMLDKEYAYGGKGPVKGFDCSGLVTHVYKVSAGLSVTGNAASMAASLRPVEAGRIQPGDLLFFNTTGAPASHVGIYVGQGRFIHSANERAGVRLDRLSGRYWAQKFEGARSVF